ncbi:MAG: phytanoyl-CoA dioxygenase family protein [Caldilineaceae bacterium]
MSEAVATQTTAAVNSNSAAPLDTQYLLSDAQVEKFIIDGYLLVTNFPAAFHASICEQIDAAFASRGNPGNEIFGARARSLQGLRRSTGAGALISLLGPDYTMNAHRHCHYTKPGDRGGHWHQDGVNQRHHQIQCVLGMYYPQEVTEEMGPTIVLPGTQYHNTPRLKWAVI